jgi:hypothetical protein
MSSQRKPAFETEQPGTKKGFGLAPLFSPGLVLIVFLTGIMTFCAGWYFCWRFNVKNMEAVNAAMQEQLAGPSRHPG